MRRTLTFLSYLMFVVMLTGCSESRVGEPPKALHSIKEVVGFPSIPNLPDYPVDEEVPPGIPWAKQTARQPWLAAGNRVAVFFTRPGIDPTTGEDPEVDDVIAQLILDAQKSVDICLFEFDRPTIVQAIAEKLSDPDVEVRFVGDGDEAEEPGYQVLDPTNPSLRPPHDRIMHNKFMVVDHRWVVTGSMNFSQSGVLRNNNNVVIVESEDLADYYTEEFEQMYSQRRFGPRKDQIPDKAPVGLAGRRVEVLFSPEDRPDERILEELEHADESVFFMIFSFTHKGIASRLIELHDSGVMVTGVFDKDQARSRYSVDDELARAGIPVFLDGNENKEGWSGGKLHHKVMIIDGDSDSDPTVITGSYNWSKGATRYNDENVIILKGKDLVRPYLEEFCEVLEVASVHSLYKGEIPDPCRALLKPLRINEVMPNPEGPDRNNEYVEIVNTGDAPVDLKGWQLADSFKVRHVFSDLTLAPGGAVVVWSGPADDGSQRIVVSTGALSLNNNVDEVVLMDPDGTVIDSMVYRSAPSGESFNRDPDGSADGKFVLHSKVEGATGRSSPGLRVDGTSWNKGTSILKVMINEVMVNPQGRDAGREFVEIVNNTEETVDISGWRLGDSVNDSRHVFAEGTILRPGEAIVVFDKGEHPEVPGAVVSSSGSLSLTNTGDQVLLYNRSGEVVDMVSYLKAPEGVSLNRAKDGDPLTDLVPHDEVEGAQGTSSPGRRVDQGHWLSHSLVINEFLPDPSGSDSGHEFVEIVNTGFLPVDLSGFTLGDSKKDDRHVFAEGTILHPFGVIVVFDRGDHSDVPGAVTSSSGVLSLNNTGDVIVLKDEHGVEISRVEYSNPPSGESLNRNPDGAFDGPFVPHSQVPGAQGKYSPGLRVDGSPWSE